MLAVKPQVPQPDIGSVLDVLAHHRPIEFDCASSPVKTDTIEVQCRADLEGRLVELFPFRPRMVPVDDRNRVAVQIVLVGGPPISGIGGSVAEATRDLLHSALDYVEKWEHHLRFGAEHQRHWGWVYRLLLAGDDAHILAVLLDQPID